MNCNEFDNILHEVIDRQTSPEKSAEIAAHLASCPRCAARMAEFEQIDGQMRSLKTAVPPDDFLREVRRKIFLEEAATRAEAHTKDSFWPTLAHLFALPFWVKVPLAALVAAVLILVSFSLLYPHHHDAVESKTEDAAQSIELVKNEPMPSRLKSASVPQPMDLEKAPAPMSKETDRALGDQHRGVQVAKNRETPASPVMAPGSESTMYKGMAGADESKPAPAPTAAPAKKEEANKAPAVQQTEDRLGRVQTQAQLAQTKDLKSVGVQRVDQRNPASPVSNLQYGVANNPQSALAYAQVSAGSDGRVAVTPPASPAVPAQRLKGQLTNGNPDQQRDAGVLSATNAPVKIQVVYWDLATGIFYTEVGKVAITGAFVRGRLDQENRFQLTSTDVEGNVIEMDARKAATQGTYGWLELSSRTFVPDGSGLKPGFPFVEGYQDTQGVFHPISRRINTTEN